MLLNKLSLLVILVVICLLSTQHFCVAEETEGAHAAEASAKTAAKKKDKNWGKMNFHDLDKEWEKGDSTEELEHDFEAIRRIQEKKRPKINMQDGASIRDAYNQDPFAFSSGGMMIFVDLNPAMPDGKAWSKTSLEFLAKRYASMLRSGGIVTTVYNIDERRLLVNLDKTWHTKEMLTFLAKQPEVESFTANSNTHKPKEYLKSIGEDVDDDDEDL